MAAAMHRRNRSNLRRHSTVPRRLPGPCLNSTGCLGETMDWAASDLDDRTLYKLLVNTVLPRPIALVTTVDPHGVLNAAPFSFFNVFSHAPPLVVLGIEGRQQPAPFKDTMANIR